MELIREKSLFHHPLTAKIVDNIRLSTDVYQLIFKCPQTAKKAYPGQFISVLCENLVLRRPFSIASADSEFIQIIYKVKGNGTEYLSSLEQGEEIDITGPLGRGFNITEESALLVGGGVGIAPLIFLSKFLEEKNIQHVLLAGFRQKINIAGLNSDKSYIVTEDNSSDLSGSVNDYIEEFLTKYNLKKIYTCGPKPVMEYAVNVAVKYNIPVEAALEREFACGTGVCMGCSIPVKDGDEIINKRICKDGPVFDGRTIIW